MIVHVRGTHGSGKSTVVKKVMAGYRFVKPVMIEGRKQPIAYICSANKRSAIEASLVVLGHYNSPCGGCDTIPNVTRIYELVRQYTDLGYHVLFEGIVAQHGIPRLLEMSKKKRYRRLIRVVMLNTSIPKSIKSVKKRRKARGNTKPFDPKNVLGENVRATNGTKRLKDAGVKVRTMSRSDAVIYISSLLT